MGRQWQIKAGYIRVIYEAYNSVKPIFRKESRRAMSSMETNSFTSLNELFYNKKTQLF